jgi:predicted transcriptional regulator
MKALTIKQPYASLVAHGIKTVENRSYAPKNLPMRIYIHAGKGVADMAEEEYAAIPKDMRDYFMKELPAGAIIGEITIEKVEENSASVWACWGSKHWILKDPALYEQPIPAKGNLGLWPFDKK